MILLESAPPSITPTTVDIPMVWRFYNSDYVTSPGRSSTYAIYFNSIGVNGESFTLAGTQFSTAQVFPFTANTFDNNETEGIAASNMASMMRLNAAFRNFNVEVIAPEGSGPWIVLATALENRPPTSEEAEFNVTGLSNITIEFRAGESPQNNGDRFWYQIWGSFTSQFTDPEPRPLTEEKFAPFDSTGRTSVDGRDAVRKFLSAQTPDIFETQTFQDVLSTGFIWLRYGAYSSDSECNTSFTQLYQTPNFPIVNAVFQHNENLFFPFIPFQVNGVARWMSRRPNRRSIYPGGYDWSAFFIPLQTVLPVRDWRVCKVLYDESGNVISEPFYEPIDERGVWRVAVGYENGIPNVNTPVDRMTVEVQGLLLTTGQWQTFSEVLDLCVVNLDCFEEIYYLEGPGSWASYAFEREDFEDTNMGADTWETPVEHAADGLPIFEDNRGVLYDQGGIYQKVQISRNAFTFTSRILRERDREIINDLLESPIVYAQDRRNYDFVGNDNRISLRRVTFDRSSYRLFQRDGGSRISISFSYAQNRRLR
ncbi:MAG: hypothetical protein AAFU67_04155 [Bacteroidota bacterium]